MWLLPVCKVRWRQNFIKIFVTINSCTCARSLILKASMVKYKIHHLDRCPCPTLDQYLIDTPSALTFIDISVNSWLRGLWLIFDQFNNESVDTWLTMNQPTVNQVSIECRPSTNQNADRGCLYYTWSRQLTTWKIIYLNCGERYEDMTDHHSYTHNLSS